MRRRPLSKTVTCACGGAGLRAAAAALQAPRAAQLAKMAAGVLSTHQHRRQRPTRWRQHEGQQGLRGPSRRFQLRKGAGSANAGLNGIVYAQKYKSDYARE